ncbi:hypothetical protein W911_13690 [Hyphomicrobium nitrativorans NL23]|uniref:Uncharacterized protein n=1 Tax=Hyphomicrobium nitrativorans NL23 TaxID=1029756 RepID=V5SIF7_9HYPH|nr:hypothetical protein W911_13690 [Hyphomicrobium nitrativorans NL23]
MESDRTLYIFDEADDASLRTFSALPIHAAPGRRRGDRSG